MRVSLASACGCTFALDLEPWCRSPEGEFRPCPVHSRLTGETGDPAGRWKGRKTDELSGIPRSGPVRPGVACCSPRCRPSELGDGGPGGVFAGGGRG